MSIALAPTEILSAVPTASSSTAPDSPPPVRPSPAVTLVISPLLKLETKTFFVALASAS